VIATASTGVLRPDVAAQVGSSSVTYSGFEFRGAIPNRYAGRTQELSYFGLTRDGVAGQLGTASAPPPAELRMPDGKRIPVEEAAAQGSLDYTLPLMERYEVTAPEDFHAFDWLSVSAAPGPDGSRFIVSDGDGAGTRAIAFNSLAGRDSNQVRVGACPQWKGYESGPLYVDVTPGTGAVSARLIR